MTFCWGSMPLTNESCSASWIRIVLFSSLTVKTPTKNKFFCLLLFEGTFTYFFKDKKSKRSHKTVGIKVLLTIFDWWEKNLDPDPDLDPYLWLTNPDPGGPKHIRIPIRICNTGLHVAEVWIIVAGTLWTTPAPSVSTGRNISRSAPRSSTWRRAPSSWITDSQSDCVMLRDSNQWGGKPPAIGPNHLKTRALQLDNWRPIRLRHA